MWIYVEGSVYHFPSHTGGANSFWVKAAAHGLHEKAGSSSELCLQGTCRDVYL